MQATHERFTQSSRQQQAMCASKTIFISTRLSLRSACRQTRSANGDGGTRVRKRSEAICGGRRQQNHTPFVSKDVTLLEPVTLVQVPTARSVG